MLTKNNLKALSRRSLKNSMCGSVYSSRTKTVENDAISLDKTARNYLRTQLNIGDDVLSKLTLSRPTTALNRKTKSKMGGNDTFSAFGDN